MLQICSTVEKPQKCSSYDRTYVIATAAICSSYNRNYVVVITAQSNYAFFTALKVNIISVKIITK